MAYDLKDSVREARRRRKRVVVLRKRDWTMKRIGDALGVSKQRIFAMLARAEQERSNGRK